MRERERHQTTIKFTLRKGEIKGRINEGTSNSQDAVLRTSFLDLHCLEHPGAESRTLLVRTSVLLSHLGNDWHLPRKHLALSGPLPGIVRSSLHGAKCFLEGGCHFLPYCHMSYPTKSSESSTESRLPVDTVGYIIIMPYQLCSFPECSRITKTSSGA